jgi:uracil-DNA glycosylase
MPTKTSALPFVPPHPTLATARAASAACKGCDLWQGATQTVFGAGPSNASVVLVGEQPGDEEDRAGKPFVGPAGRVLDRALAEAGIKHFSWEPRGKRLALIKPRAVVCLGATATLALLGAGVKVMRDRGRLLESTIAPIVMTTVHPSSILRAQTDDERAAAMKAFVKDLKTLVSRLRS